MVPGNVNQSLSTEDAQTPKETKPIEVIITNNGKKKSPWDTLEITKLFIGLLTPVAIWWFTTQTNKNFDANNKIQDNNKRVFEIRQRTYDSISLSLNDMFCYNLYIGNWKELSPKDIIFRKRKVDRYIYSYSQYFDTTFKPKYDSFMNSIFVPYGGEGKDALIRSEFEIRKKYYKLFTNLDWDDNWNTRFTNEDNYKNISKYYNELLQEFSHELILNVDYSQVEIKDPQKPSK